MILTWVLVFYISNGYGEVVVTDFETKASCEAAAQKLKEKFYTKGHVCLYKLDEDNNIPQK